MTKRTEPDVQARTVVSLILVAAWKVADTLGLMGK
jgi:hypothetical protein